VKRFLVILAMVAGTATLIAQPASAQYGGGDEPTESGCTTDTGEPCQPRATATVSDDVVQPGDATTVSTPPVFAPGSPVTINLVRVDPGASPDLSESSTTDSSGAAGESITIPDVESGVYFIYVVGLDADGNRVVAIVPIVIENASAAVQSGSAQSESAQTDSVQGDDLQAASAAPVPAAVAEVQTDLSTDTEAAIVDAVVAGDTGLALAQDGTLNVRTPQGTQAASALPTTGSDISGYVTAGAALLLAGTGLVLMRRRKEAQL